MEFGIQMGYGLQTATEELVNKWGGGTVVVSPRVFRMPAGTSIEGSLERYCKRISRKADKIFLDPMLYVKNSQIRQIASTQYAITANTDGYLSAVADVLALNRTCGTTATIVPSWTCETFDDGWAAYQTEAGKLASSAIGPERAYTTVSLTSEMLKQDGAIDWIESVSYDWESRGVFLALEHPGGKYLTDEPLWLLNALCLAAAFKRMGKKVMVGYGSHQLLLSALANSDYLCSGNFLNVRRFSSSDFKAREDDTPSRRAKWYYVPQALSEYRLPTLDLAQSLGLLDLLRSPYDDEYDAMLFSSSIPSSTGYNEGHSFRHYLHCLHEQSRQLTAKSYDEALSACLSLVRTADRIIEGLSRTGISDKDRNFSQASSACSQAISAFDTKMGFVMHQIWTNG